MAVSDEKIDLAVVVARAEYELKNGRPSEFAEDVLVMVAALRAAMTFAYGSTDEDETIDNFDALEAALAPFTDSAEVRDE